MPEKARNPGIFLLMNELRQFAGRDAQAALRAEQGAVAAHDVALQPGGRHRRLDVEIVGLRDPRALRVPAFVAVLLATGASIGGTQEVDLSKFTIVDLSHAYGPSTVFWPTSCGGPLRAIALVPR